MTAGHALASAHLRVGVGGRAHGRFVLLLGLGTLAVLVGVVVGVAVGTVGIAPVDTLAVVLSHLGLQVGTVPSEATDAIVWDIRIPRVLTALAVGAALAVAGVTFQGLLRNPLADPYVLGTASGAALGAAIAVLLPVRTLVLGFGLVHALAFAGALVAVWAVYRLSRISGMAPMTGLLLTGYAVGSLLAAGLTMAMYLSGARCARSSRSCSVASTGRPGHASRGRSRSSRSGARSSCCGLGRSTGCCWARRRRRTWGSMSAVSGACCSVSRHS